MIRRSLVSVLLAVGLLFGVAPAALGQISFVFNYTDANGSGFNDTTLGGTRQAALASAASLLAGYFTGSTATLTFSVASTSSSGSGTLASAGSSISAVNGFQKTSIQSAVQGNGSGTGTINWNFGYSWDYDNSVAGDALDFRAVALHELLHAFGFASFISATGQGGFSNASGTADAWTFFDQFLTTANGTRLVNTSFQFNTAGVGTLLTNGTSSDVYFSGPNAMAANGGGRVPIFSPATFIQGSSLGHLDTTVYGSNNYIMTHAVSYGPAVRTLSAIELGILTDLGYSLVAIPEPSSVSFIVGTLALAVGLVVRRRRGQRAA